MTDNYVQEAWEERFQIKRQSPRSSRFALGFVLGAAMTGAAFFWFSSATAATLAF